MPPSIMEYLAALVLAIILVGGVLQLEEQHRITFPPTVSLATCDLQYFTLPSTGVLPRTTPLAGIASSMDSFPPLWPPSHAHQSIPRSVWARSASSAKRNQLYQCSSMARYLCFSSSLQLRRRTCRPSRAQPNMVPQNEPFRSLVDYGSRRRSSRPLPTSSHGCLQ